MNEPNSEPISTPLTDAVAFFPEDDRGYIRHVANGSNVTSAFARALERQLIETRNKLEKLLSKNE